MTINIDDLEGLWQRAKTRPRRTILLALACVAIFLAGAYAYSFVSQKGEQHAFSTQNVVATPSQSDADSIPTATLNPPGQPHIGEIWANPEDDLPYVWIPSGEFEMGCSPGDQACNNDEKPQHTVRITRGFWLGQTEVTQAAYIRLMFVNPSRSKHAERPIEGVPWEDAKDYCAMIGGRLPTESEWEYAARANYTESTYGELHEIAWYYENSNGETQKVGGKLPNAWGLYDMLGNVWEWTTDWHSEDYRSRLAPVRDPQGPPTGHLRVIRGGAWTSLGNEVRLSNREWKDEHDLFLGFRCAVEGL